jgi:fumarate reductase subunit D
VLHRLRTPDGYVSDWVVVVVTQTEVLGRYLIAYVLVAVSVCTAKKMDHGCEEAHVSHSHFLAHQMICYDAVAQIRSDPGTVLYCNVLRQ